MAPAFEPPPPLLGRESQDLALMARVSGTLYACGALLLVLSLALPHPSSTNDLPLYVIAGLAALVGAGLFHFSGAIQAWMIHSILATASVLVSLCIYFSGVAAGVYGVMFVWVVIVAACVGSRFTLTLHLAWLMAAYGSVLIALHGASAGFSPVTRFVLTGFGLSAAGAAVAWLVEGRRMAEAGLHREIETREELQRELQHLANHDPLTGVANRRRLEEHLDAEMAEATKTRAPLCLIALDLDGFKEFNDKNGHAAGDRLLKAVASSWDAALRDGDLITRMGGDEFVVVLPNCPQEVADRIATRLRVGVPEGQSCSVGISHWNGSDTAEEFLFAADKALYKTKAARGGTLAG